MTQRKITDTIQEIPHRERKSIEEDDLRQRRFQMREMKENLWKWRGRKPEKKKAEETAESELKKLEEKLRKLEELLMLTRREKS